MISISPKVAVVDVKVKPLSKQVCRFAAVPVRDIVPVFLPIAVTEPGTVTTFNVPLGTEIVRVLLASASAFVTLDLGSVTVVDVPSPGYEASFVSSANGTSGVAGTVTEPLEPALPVVPSVPSVPSVPVVPA